MAAEGQDQSSSDTGGLRGMAGLPPGRLLMIDGLRGIAALAVVLFHLFAGPYQTYLPAATPRPLRFFFHQGLNGVAIFFVISGFVIAHSLRNASARRGSFRRFILRRQLRLDPPYWAALFVVLIDLWVDTFRKHSWAAMPGFRQFIAHLFYLQDVTRQTNIMLVSWTLCLEIMFYLAYMALLCCREKLPGKLQRIWSIATTWGLAILALLFLPNPFDWPHAAWLPPYWPLFVMGICTYQVVQRDASPWYLTLLWVVAFVAALLKGETPLLWACGTSVLIYTAFRRGTLDQWLSSWPFQFLGKISYSLYLIHVTVAGRILDYLYRHEPHSVPIGWMALAAALLASIGCAYLFYLGVEQPSIRLSARFKRSRQKTPAALPASGPLP